MVHQLIRVLESGGEGAAAALVAKLGSQAETARELCYRLYTLCERKKRATEAMAYNGLVQSWPEITRLAQRGAARRHSRHRRPVRSGVAKMPVSKRILCLANSRKLSGRCIAGIEVSESGVPHVWIRPVSSREHEEVSEHERQYEDGSDPHVLDVIDVPTLEPRPMGYQQENWLIDRGYYWVRPRRASVPDPRLWSQRWRNCGLAAIIPTTA